MFNKILAVTAAVVNSSELHPGTDPAAINGPMSVLLQNVLYKGSLSLPRTCRKKGKFVHHRASQGGNSKSSYRFDCS